MKKDMSADLWFATAEQFTLAAWMLREESSKNVAGQFLVIPHVVCRAFSTEAYLKCLLTLRGKRFPADHDLRRLFGMLPIDDKLAIKDWWNAETLPGVLRASANPPPDLQNLPTTFEQCLKRSAMAFLEGRYRTKKNMYWYLGHFPGQVQRRILEIRPGWKQLAPKAFPGNPNP